MDGHIQDTDKDLLLPLVHYFSTSCNVGQVNFYANSLRIIGSPNLVTITLTGRSYLRYLYYCCQKAVSPFALTVLSLQQNSAKGNRSDIRNLHRLWGSRIILRKDVWKTSSSYSISLPNGLKLNIMSLWITYHDPIKSTIPHIFFFLAKT